MECISIFKEQQFPESSTDIRMCLLLPHTVEFAALLGGTAFPICLIY